MVQHPQTPHPTPPIPRGTQVTPNGAGTPPHPAKTQTPWARPHLQTPEDPHLPQHLAWAQHPKSLTPPPKGTPVSGSPLPATPQHPKRLRDPPQTWGPLKRGPTGRVSHGPTREMSWVRSQPARPPPPHEPSGWVRGQIMRGGGSGGGGSPSSPRASVSLPGHHQHPQLQCWEVWDDGKGGVKRPPRDPLGAPGPPRSPRSGVG